MNVRGNERAVDMVLAWREAVNHFPGRAIAAIVPIIAGIASAAAAAMVIAISGAATSAAQERASEQAAAAAGLRAYAGAHVTLFTDVTDSPEIASLPQAFDAAVPQWREYFGVSKEATKNWRLTAFLMADRERFRGAGVLPADLPPFLHGYSRGLEVWLDDQPSDYYRRHLLLHEGVHGFMQSMLGRAGPPWYMEGTAELLATHRWRDGELTVNYFPQARDEVPYWGRIKIVQDEFAAGRGLMLPDVFALDRRAHLRNEPYGWCWAAAAFLDGHPRYRERFRKLKDRLAAPDAEFSSGFMRELAPDARQLAEDWQLFVAEMDYGYDLERSAIQRQRNENLTDLADLPVEGVHVKIDAQAGWQSSGVRVPAGEPCLVLATGRYQVGDDPKPWICEPPGVTIEYHRGRPLGLLMAAVAPDDASAEGEPEGKAITRLLSAAPVGAKRDSPWDSAGVLYFRINEASAGLANNRGSLSVTIRRPTPEDKPSPAADTE